MLFRFDNKMFDLGFFRQTCPSALSKLNLELKGNFKSSDGFPFVHFACRHECAFHGLHTEMHTVSRQDPEMNDQCKNPAWIINLLCWLQLDSSQLAEMTEDKLNLGFE